MTVVYVLAPDRTPLMPCSCAIARLLLKEGKAIVRRRTPFTIKLLVQQDRSYRQPLTLGVDTGSSVFGSAVADEQRKVVYLGEVEVRNDIAMTMKERATHRRTRRQRKIRYRKPRWLRKNSIKKEHCFDATMIATRGSLPIFHTTSVLYKRCVSDGDYQQTKGIRSEQRIITGKIRGFRKFDTVRYFGNEYFIKGRMNTGYAILMDIHGKKVELKPIPKFEKMKRVSARSSWMMTQQPMPTFSSSLI